VTWGDGRAPRGGERPAAAARLLVRGDQVEQRPVDPERADRSASLSWEHPPRLSMPRAAGCTPRGAMEPLSKLWI
jgi:hypothetical protein